MPTFSPLVDLEYRTIWVVQDRNHWMACLDQFEPEKDLVLAVDTGLFLQLKAREHQVEYFGRFLDNQYVQELNKNMHHFIHNWFKDSEGNDQLVYEGKYTMGDAFLLSILGEVTFFCHFFTYFLHLAKLKAQTIRVAVEDDLMQVFEKTGLAFEKVEMAGAAGQHQYLFPIKQWMADAIKPKGLKAKLKTAFTASVDYVCRFLDLFEGRKKRIFIQEHHPTRPIIAALRNTGQYKIINPTIQVLKGFWENEGCCTAAFPALRSGLRRCWRI